MATRRGRWLRRVVIVLCATSAAVAAFAIGFRWGEAVAAIDSNFQHTLEMDYFAKLLATRLEAETNRTVLLDDVKSFSASYNAAYHGVPFVAIAEATVVRNYPSPREFCHWSPLDAPFSLVQPTPSNQHLWGFSASDPAPPVGHQ